jgi:hypothetical protein
VSPDLLADLMMAARDVVAEWGDGDGVDPDRMDERVAALRSAYWAQHRSIRR